VKKHTEPITTAKQRGGAITELLFALATLGAAVVAVAMTDPKIPTMVGD